MKKLLILGLAMLTMLFAGCSSTTTDDSAESTTTDTSTSTDTTTDTTTDTSEDTATDTSADTTSDDATLNVVVSFYPMYDFAEKIGGDHVTVQNLTPAGTEPHDWEPAATDIKSIQNSDVFIYSGASMEHWVDDVLAGLDDYEGTVVEASDGITLRVLQGTAEDDDVVEDSSEATEEDEEAGSTDPHVWLNPQNALKEMENIKDGLVAADPDNAADYEANYEAQVDKINALDEEYSESLAPYEGRSIVVAHQAFGYLADAYGLKQVPIEGLEADAEPDAERMAAIIETVEEENISTIFFEDLVSPKVAEAIAEETGATTAELNPLEGLSDEDIAAGEEYYSVMESNLQTLVEALSSSGESNE